jgi:hypothetical protein
MFAKFLDYRKRAPTEEGSASPTTGICIEQPYSCVQDSLILQLEHGGVVGPEHVRIIRLLGFELNNPTCVQDSWIW